MMRAFAVLVALLVLAMLFACESDSASQSSQREREHERRVSDAWYRSEQPIRIPDSGVTNR